MDLIIYYVLHLLFLLLLLTSVRGSLPGKIELDNDIIIHLFYPTLQTKVSNNNTINDHTINKCDY